MNKITYILICHFGLEKVLKNEVRRLGFEISEVTDGEVKVLGDINDIPKLNFNLRTCERVMIELGNFKAVQFEDLYQGVLKLPIEDFVPINGAFPITKANQDKNSILHSSTSIQSITKKAMVERLMNAYNTKTLIENRGKYPFRVKFNKNIASIRLDTTGDSLHKRGYRIKSGLAPIEETLASALIKVCGFNDKMSERYSDVLVDPFCGSGTIPIEAAMIMCNMPPSIDRAFVSETWEIINKKTWIDAKNEAKSKIKDEVVNNNEIKIFGFDIDPNMIRIAKENAIRAGVSHMIHFETLPVKELGNYNKISKINKGMILTNPPYGERLEDKETIIPIYNDLKKSYYSLKSSFDLNVITSFEGIKDIFGKEDKNRKLYNGMIKTYLYSYYAKGTY